MAIARSGSLTAVQEPPLQCRGFELVAIAQILEPNYPGTTHLEPARLTTRLQRTCPWTRHR